MAAIEARDQSVSRRGAGSPIALSNASRESAVNRIISAYERASWEYQTSSGLNAQSAAATRPVLRPTSSRPSTNASGIVRVPNRAESDLSPNSPVPKTFDQIQAAT